jgi:WD40 repeat protein
MTARYGYGTWLPHHQIGNPLIGHIGAVHSVAFSPDGKILASGSSDQIVRFWNVIASGQNVANTAELARYPMCLDRPIPPTRRVGTMRVRAGLPTGLPLDAKPQQRKLEDSRV